MLSNRMAAVGLALIIITAAAAIAAPLITPYSPRGESVAANYAQPTFITYFPEGYYLSQNMLAVKDPLFNSASSLQAWGVTANPATMSNLIVSYAPGVSSVSTSKGSMQLSYSGESPATILLSRTFSYPYHGPPGNFYISVTYLVSMANAKQPVNIGVSINRIGDHVFHIWGGTGQVNPSLYGNVTSSNEWQVPNIVASGVIPDSSPQVESEFPGLTSLTGLGPAAVIFSRSQDYSFQISLTFYGPGRVNLDQLQLQLLGTSWGILGTDYVGTDLFSQLVYGARVSLLVGLTAAFLGIGLGLLIGLMAGFLGTLTDEILMRFTDMILVIPYLPLLIVLVAVLGASITNIILVIGLFSWMGFARVIRSQVLSLKERPFVEAARASGAGSTRIIVSHIFPNIVSLTYVNLALTVPAAILTESALEFLGLGDVNTISWGHMFYLAQLSSSLQVWWWVIPPGLAIAAVSLSFVLIGYALDELFNPKRRRRR